MATVKIDPDGVIALSAATLGVADQLEDDCAALQRLLDDAAVLVPGAPAAGPAGRGVAGDLAELAGWGRQVALQYIDHEKPLHDLIELGFWLPHLDNLSWHQDESAGQNLERVARTDETGAFVFGLAGDLLGRYRRWSLYQPVPGVRLPELPPLDLPAPDLQFRGAPYVWQDGLYVPQSVASSTVLADASGRAARLADGPGWRETVGRTLLTDAELGRPPTWARVGGKGLFVVGTALTLYDSWATQWDSDQKYHPEYSGAERVASAAYTTTFEGGGAVVGAIYGAEVGAAIGTAILPVGGTLVGGLVGGAVGAFVGSKAGRAAGTVLKEGVTALGSGATKVWHSLFG